MYLQQGFLLAGGRGDLFPIPVDMIQKVLQGKMIPATPSQLNKSLHKFLLIGVFFLQGNSFCKKLLILIKSGIKFCHSFDTHFSSPRLLPVFPIDLSPDPGAIRTSTFMEEYGRILL